MLETVPFGSYPPTWLASSISAVGQRMPDNILGRRLAAWLRGLLRRANRHPIDTKVLGMRMRLRATDNACERRLLVTPQFFDPEEFKLIGERIHPEFHFVDVGANVGTYSLIAATRGAKRVLAFEPLPPLQLRLLENAAFNDVRIELCPNAVTDHAGEIEFNVDLRNYGGSSIYKDRKNRGGIETIMVKCVSLWDALQQYGFKRIDALKADLEGAEDRALVPFFEQAPRELWPRLVIIEDSSAVWRTDLIGMMKSLGYVQIRGGGNVLLEFVEK